MVMHQLCILGIRAGLVTGLLMIIGCSQAPTYPTATTSGLVQGLVEEGIQAYRGIPYAAPPVGELRWRAPQSMPPWSDVKQTHEYGPACWQVADAGDALFLGKLTEGAGMSAWSRWVLDKSLSLFSMTVAEDCLTLNVFAPEGAKVLPVMVWIHGGGHQFGSGGANYESAGLVNQEVVLVTINYRLGVYGFMAHPELAAEDPNGSSGNYGMLDQIAALQWVQSNIAGFGGDPANVTIFGESAGGHSVGQLMASPLSQGLFHKAIAQSGTGFYQFQATDQAPENISGFEAGRKVAELAGVSGANEISALRTMSVDELKSIALDPEISSTFHPQVDGNVLPFPTAYTFKQAAQHPVPLMVGSNADEGSVLYSFGLTPVDGSGAEPPTTVDQWEQLLTSQFGDNADVLANAYPVDNNTDVVGAATHLMGDAWFGRHAFYMAQAHSAAGNPSYLYFYERHPPSAEQTIGASHALEINHVFGGLIPFWPSDDRDSALSAEMMGYWTNFARSGNPNDENLPMWPTFNDLEPKEMAFGHLQTNARPVARQARYRAMQPQLDRRVTAAVNMR